MRLIRCKNLVDSYASGADSADFGLVIGIRHTGNDDYIVDLNNLSHFSQGNEFDNIFLTSLQPLAHTSVLIIRACHACDALDLARKTTMSMWLKMRLSDMTECIMQIIGESKRINGSTSGENLLGRTCP